MHIPPFQDQLRSVNTQQENDERARMEIEEKLKRVSGRKGREGGMDIDLYRFSWMQLNLV